MPISRRMALKGLGTAGAASMLGAEAGAAQDQGLKIADHRVCSTGCELRVDVLLHCPDPQLLEAIGLLP